MTDLVTNSYRHKNFPLTLYRVQYPGCNTSLCDKCGLCCENSVPPSRVNDLKNAVHDHLTWRQVPSPFISTFGNRQHAENWARDWSRRNENETCHILEIEMEEKDNVIVFRVNNLVKRLGNITSRPSSEYHSEYLCLRRIPGELIVSCEPVDGVAVNRLGRLLTYQQ